jgi:PAS domain S-box-containing protein
MLIQMTPNPAKSSAAGRILGTGEMADRVRAHDWAATSLGPIENWSKELVTIVNLTLCSPSPARTMWGPDFLLIYNDTYSPIPGKRHPACLGQPAKEIYGEAWHVVGPLLEKAFATGETCYYEKLAVPLATEDGVEDRYLNYSFNPIYEDGKIAGLFGPLHDMTGEVLAMQERSAMAEALRESQERMNAIYSSSIEYIGILTPEGIILDCNRASLEFAGNTHEEVLGMHFADGPWFAYTPGAPGILREVIARAAGGEFIRSELPLIRPNGETITFDFSLAPVRDADGKVIFLVPEGRDINELKRAEAALLQSEKLAAVGRLASSIAHEINNPLESVMNLIYLARSHARVPEAQQYLDLADQEIRRVSIIANQTLRFHKQSTNPQAVKSLDLYNSVLSIYEGRLRNSNISVERRLRTEQPVMCFEGEVRQVLSNLISNAIDAMPTGGRLLLRDRKGTHWATGREGIVLTIADTGSGMSVPVLSSIFDAFFTTKGIAGTGLGLWVSQEIVKRHHGALHVRSAQGKGTVFALFLPFDAERR